MPGGKLPISRGSKEVPECDTCAHAVEFLIRKIGLLLATGQANVVLLLMSLCALVAAEQAILLDEPACNRAALRLVQCHAMQTVFETAQMYANAAPVIALEHTFGVIMYDLG